MHILSYHHINHSFKYFHIPKKMIDVPLLKLHLMPDHKHSLIWCLLFLWLECKMSLTDSYIWIPANELLRDDQVIDP